MAIAIRIVLFLIALIIGVIGYYVFGFDAAADFSNWFGMFSTFDWDASWGYWVLVIIGSFLAEMGLWS